jgi:hypothetical protein
MGLIYLINEYETDNYKIGVTRSNSDKHRKRTLQTGNSKKLETIHIFKTDYPYRIETMLHNHYHKNKVNGEWFKLNENEILGFMPLCEKMSTDLKFLMESNYFFQKINIK